MDEVKTPQYPQFYIASKSSPAEDRTGVLKYGQTFAIFDRFGDIELGGLGEQGIYHEGTRHLSEWALFLGNSRPLLLSSTVNDDNTTFTADLTNIDVTWNDRVLIPRGTLHLRRSKVLWGGACYEQLVIANYGMNPIRIPVAFKFASDFADIFEVRGTKRSRRGDMLNPEVEPHCVVQSYRGLDQVVRRTHLSCRPVPQKTSAEDFQLLVDLEPQDSVRIHLSIACTNEVREIPFERAVSSAAATIRTAAGVDAPSIGSSNSQFNNWTRRSMADIKMMTAGNPESNYPYAGVPWFSTIFGRDGIITALEYLWLDPTLAKGVLLHLAATQAHEVSLENDAEPGKILHESRLGEMAALGEVPFRRYYGAVDATPLFVMLAGAYYRRTADLSLVSSIWRNLEAAIAWIDQYGDRDGDGFVEYARKSPHGLVQQGWKDSSDSIFHADGTSAEPPIALCEVQGYVYAAKRDAALLAGVLGKHQQAREWDASASRLQEQFERVFWCPDLATYALALDGRKQPCRVRSSNPGHCLYTQIAGDDHASAIAANVLAPSSFSGWGIRTLSVSEARYNPISYHNGSVWPHDNALIAAGLAKYGFKRIAARLLESFLAASTFFHLYRMPELFCGLDRREGEGPILYPVACNPQSWAAGSVFMLLEACLGITIHTPSKGMQIADPVLPSQIEELQIDGLRVGDARVGLRFSRKEDDCIRVDVVDTVGQIDVVVR